VAVGGAVSAAVTCQVAGCGQDQAKLALSGVNLSQAVVAVLAVLAISGEYSTGMIRVTLAAMPRRTAQEPHRSQSVWCAHGHGTDDVPDGRAAGRAARRIDNRAY